MNIRKIIQMVPLVFILVLFARPNLSAQGHFEFGVHYSKWSVNVLKSLIERELGKALEGSFKDTLIEEIQQDYPDMLETLYEQSVSFDSGGSNYGFEIRWYPGGYKGSFSLGFSVEKTELMLSFPSITANLELQDTGTGQTASLNAAVTNVEFRLKAMSFHFNFCWDIFPSWIIHPYFTFGLGAAFDNALGNASYGFSWDGDLEIPGQQSEHYETSETKTIQELKDETLANGDEFSVPEFLFRAFPFVQSTFGLKASFTRNFHLMVEVGLLNGFILRGGVALRL